jgi:hypothetical protein
MSLAEPAHLHQLELTADQRMMLVQIMDGWEQSTRLDSFQRHFCASQADRYRKFKCHMGVTTKQWPIFERIHRQMFPPVGA